MAYFISIDLKERAISIHMQISGRIFCNLADLCRLLFATCNDNQVISKSITLPTTTLTLLQCHVVCILQTRHPWGNGDGQLSLLFVPNVMFNITCPALQIGIPQDTDNGCDVIVVLLIRLPPNLDSGLTS